MTVASRFIEEAVGGTENVPGLCQLSAEKWQRPNVTDSDAQNIYGFNTNNLQITLELKKTARNIRWISAARFQTGTPRWPRWSWMANGLVFWFPPFSYQFCFLLPGCPGWISPDGPQIQFVAALPHCLSLVPHHLCRWALLILVSGFFWVNPDWPPGFRSNPGSCKTVAPHGIQLEFTRIRWRVVRGIVAENVRLGGVQPEVSPTFSVGEIQIRLRSSAPCSICRLQVRRAHPGHRR